MTKYEQLQEHLKDNQNTWLLTGDVRHSQTNIDKAQVLLDYQPEYIISQGMGETMDWYVESLNE